MCFWLQTILFPLSLSTCLLSYDKKKNLRFSKWNETHCEAKIYPALSLGRGMLFLFLWLTWKENRGFSLSLALLASLVQYGWTSNDWLPVICVTIGATRGFYALCCAVNEVGQLSRGRTVFQIQPLDGGATPDSKQDLLGDDEENYN